MSFMKVTCDTLENTEQAAKTFVSKLSPNATATMIGLSGDLGSGKTTFVKAAAAALGVEQTVTSPTFVIEKIYKLEGQPFARLVHIDAYRLESSRELEALGFATLLEDPQNLIFIEWPERVKDVLPADMHTIRFTFIDETTREISS